MNKSLILGAVVFTIILASCKKDYTCTCTTETVDFWTDSVITTVESTTINDKEADAEETCLNRSSVNVFTQSTKTCELEN